MSTNSFVRKCQGKIPSVTVIYPFTYNNPYYCLPPLAAEYVQAAVHATGRNAALYDMRFESDIRKAIEKSDCICLFGFHEDCSIFGKWKYHVIDEIIEQIPETTPVIAGGTGFTDIDTILNKYEKIDIIIQGNPEYPIINLLESGSPVDIPNLVYREDDRIVKNKRELYSLPEKIYPQRHLRKKEYRYHGFGIGIDLVRAAVGCNYQCKFCYQYGKAFDGEQLKWRSRSAESLYNEISEISAPIILWVDDDMTTDMVMLRDLAELLLQNEIQKLFAGTGRLDHVLKGDVLTLQLLEKAGFVALAFGVESLKPETLKLYGKGHSIEKIEQAMKMMQKTNILLTCNFIFGSPGETEEDMMDMLWFGRKWDVDTVVTNRLQLQRDSELYRMTHNMETGEPFDGYERITGDDLAAIKYRVKFGQRTPTRLLLSILKLYRHKGMFIDPMYIVCSILLEMTRFTFLEKTMIVPYVLKGTKAFLAFSPTRSVMRIAAVIATPPVYALNFLFEKADRKLNLSTKYLPQLLLAFRKNVYKKQKRQVQLER